MRIYTVYDKVAKQYGPLFEAKNDGVAVRRFEQMIKKEIGLTDMRGDFCLYFVGAFDRDEGEFTNSEPVVIVTGYEVIEYEKES